MNRSLLFRLITIFMVLILTQLNISAETDGIVTTVVKKHKPSRKRDLSEKGNRAPTRPINCTISHTDGIIIAGCHELFESYEIWDTSGETRLFLSYDETSFLEEFFSLPLPFMFILNTPDYSLGGYNY